MKKFRDIEQLSAYLDGQLSPSDSARVESRTSSDPELDSVLSDLRAARGILRKLPQRKAPRNFTLTRAMVGLKPPLPRTFSIFRFSSAFATILLVLTFAANILAPKMGFGAAAPVAEYALGMGGGGGCDTCSPEMFAADAPAATEAPVATELPALAPPIETGITATPELLPMSTETIRIAAPTEIPTAKDAGTLEVPQDQPPVTNDALIPLTWQIGLLVIVLLSALIMYGLRQSAIRKWK